MKSDSRSFFCVELSAISEMHVDSELSYFNNHKHSTSQASLETIHFLLIKIFTRALKLQDLTCLSACPPPSESLTVHTSVSCSNAHIGCLFVVVLRPSII